MKEGRPIPEAKFSIGDTLITIQKRDLPVVLLPLSQGSNREAYQMGGKRGIYLPKGASALLIAGDVHMLMKNFKAKKANGLPYVDIYAGGTIETKRSNTNEIYYYMEGLPAVTFDFNHTRGTVEGIPLACTFIRGI